MNQRLRISVGWLLLVCLSPLLITFFLFELYRFPLSVPFGYQGDAYFSTFIVKHLLTQGFSFNNPLLGFPAGLQLYDFPFSDTSYFLLTKGIGLVSQNSFFVVNLHYLGSFMMIAITSWLIWRQLGISSWYAWWGSLLFSFLPFHLIRGVYHLFLGNYWFVPLVAFVALWITDPSLFSLPTFLNDSRRKYLILGLLAMVAGTSGLYYALFSIFLLLGASCLTVLRKHQWRSFLTGITISTGIAIILLLQLFPTLIYTNQAGKNTGVGTRFAFEADTNSLSLMRLAMPIQDIGIDSMREHVFDPTRPLVDMEKKQFLGWGGLLGLGLITYMAVIRPSDEKNRDHRWQLLFVFSLAIFGLAMTGGVGTIMAYAISPQIRAYGRILPFLAFFALTGLLFWIDSHESKKTQTLSFFGTLIMIGSLWSQLSWFKPATPVHKNSFESDQAFFAEIDSINPRAVYQLPYKAFPETPEIERLSDYDLLKGYLHTQQPIGWSYASMKGRAQAEWLQGVSQFPVEVQLESIRQVGFEGVYIDRYGFADNGEVIEASLSGLLRQTPLVSNDGRLVYYQL